MGEGCGLGLRKAVQVLRQFFLVAVAFCLGTAVAQVGKGLGLTCQESVGRVHELGFETDLYRKAVEVFVYTPPCYESSQLDYPVLYLLHGGGGSPRVWLRTFQIPALADELILSQQISPLIIVMPKQIDYGVLFAGHLEAAIQPSINERFRALRETAFQGVAGISAGGGSVTHLMFAQDSLLFASAAIIAGIPSVSEELIVTKSAVLAESELPVRFLLDVGDEDGLKNHHDKLHAYFTELNLQHDYWMGEGGHNVAYFLPRMPDYLVWFDEQWKAR